MTPVIAGSTSICTDVASLPADKFAICIHIDTIQICRMLYIFTLKPAFSFCCGILPSVHIKCLTRKAFIGPRGILNLLAKSGYLPLAGTFLSKSSHPWIGEAHGGGLTLLLLDNLSRRLPRIGRQGQSSMTPLQQQ